jgi:Domain of unknown function (DUF4397)
VGRFSQLVRLCVSTLFLGTVLLTAGCGGGGQTRFRLMNAVPDQTNLDVLVDTTSLSPNLAYGTSTGYQSISSGSHQIAIEPSGSSTPLLTQSISFSSDSDTTVISSNFSSNIQNMVLTDDNSAPASGDFKIRIVNAAPGLGPADVYIVAPATDLNAVSPNLSNLNFGSASNYLSFTGGSFEIVLTPVGQKFTAVNTGTLTLSSGQVRTFVGLNSQSGGFSYTMLQDVN